MAVGRNVEAGVQVPGFRREISAAATVGDDSFFTWFDSAPSAEAAFRKGAWDFSTHVATPLLPFVNAVEGLTALEIGHGGGRLLAAASRHFSAVIGVDIHDHNVRVLQELQARGVSNATLHQSDGKTLPVESGSVDVVYSFIVLQHVGSVEVLDRYMSECFRVLKPGGTAMLYVGRRSWLSRNTGSPLLTALDRGIERIAIRGGVREVPARVNDVNLFLTRSHAADRARSHGFQLLATCTSRRRLGERLVFGGQHGLVLRRPA